ncbi:MAG: TIGR03086 family metal-binding protein [Acidimicrobiales bacterium]
MSEITERYRSVAAGFTDGVIGVAPDAWSRPTPCSDSTARQLMARAVSTRRRVSATLDTTEAVDDVAPESATTALTAAPDDEGRASTVVGGMFGEQLFSSLVGRLICADTLVPTWDLARGTDQDGTLDAVAVAKAAEAPEPIDEAIRRPGGFSEKAAPAPGADDQTRFLNFCGPRLTWPSSPPASVGGWRRGGCPSW